MRRLPFLAVNLVGALSFLAPFLIDMNQKAEGFAARAGDSIWVLALATPLLIATAITEGISGRMDAKRLALLGVLAGCAAMMRLPLSFAGANLFFVLPIASGIVFGPVFGFLVGSAGMAASGLITGGFGPWLPFQMFTAGWVGLGAGVVGMAFRSASQAFKSWAAAVYSGFAAFGYGAVINLYFWPVTVQSDSAIAYSADSSIIETVIHYSRFYLLTSLAWDAVGAIANVAVMVTLGRAIIEVLSRYQKRFGFVFEPLPDAPRSRPSTRLLVLPPKQDPTSQLPDAPPGRAVLPESAVRNP